MIEVCLPLSCDYFFLIYRLIESKAYFTLALLGAWIVPSPSLASGKLTAYVTNFSAALRISSVHLTS
jgi:hypothetical protein